jgi:hypothetical protein
LDTALAALAVQADFEDGGGDRFATVMGDGRGGGINDTVAATAPSARAQAELAELLADQTLVGLAAATAVLEGHRHQADTEHPLLAELALKLAARYIFFAYAENENAFNLLLDTLGIAESVELPDGIERACAVAYGAGVARACKGRIKLAESMSDRAQAAAVEMFNDFAGRALATHLPLNALNRVLEAGRGDGRLPGPGPSFAQMHSYVRCLRPRDCKRLVAAASAQLVGSRAQTIDEALELVAVPVCEKLCELAAGAERRRESGLRTRMAHRRS